MRLGRRSGSGRCARGGAAETGEGVVYEGTLFAKIDESYLEAKKSHSPDQAEKTQSPVPESNDQVTVMPRSPQ